MQWSTHHERGASDANRDLGRIQSRWAADKPHRLNFPDPKRPQIALSLLFKGFMNSTRELEHSWLAQLGGNCWPWSMEASPLTQQARPEVFQQKVVELYEALFKVGRPNYPPQLEYILFQSEADCWIGWRWSWQNRRLLERVLPLETG